MKRGLVALTFLEMYIKITKYGLTCQIIRWINLSSIPVDIFPLLFTVFKEKVLNIYSTSYSLLKCIYSFIISFLALFKDFILK